MCARECACICAHNVIMMHKFMRNTNVWVGGGGWLGGVGGSVGGGVTLLGGGGGGEQGTRQAPQCGFTDATIALFDQLQVDYECIDCLDEVFFNYFLSFFLFIFFFLF